MASRLKRVVNRVVTQIKREAVRVEAFANAETFEFKKMQIEVKILIFDKNQISPFKRFFNKNRCIEHSFSC